MLKWFNRTFMELKSFWHLIMIVQSGGFNRTFMELKFTGLTKPTVNLVGLIVPLWN